MTRRARSPRGDEWISVSDLMASVVGVVLLLLVVTARKLHEDRSREQVQRQAAERASARAETNLQIANICQEQASRDRQEHDRRMGPVIARLRDLRSRVEREGNANTLQIDPEAGRITLTNPADLPTFRNGSACPSPTGSALLLEAALALREVLATTDARVHVEGHANSVQFTAPDHHPDQCLVVHDNFILSAQRALSARSVLMESGGLAAYAQRVVLSAYGDMRPRYQPSRDGRNRRIEIQVRWE